MKMIECTTPQPIIDPFLIREMVEHKKRNITTGLYLRVFIFNNIVKAQLVRTPLESELKFIEETTNMADLPYGSLVKHLKEVPENELIPIQGERS